MIRRREAFMPRNGWLVALALGLSIPLSPGAAHACTIVVLTDGERVLFCNNEDWSNPNTRIWFVPGGVGRGCAFVSFDNGWARGAGTRKGRLDWVAGFRSEVAGDPARKRVPGNPSQRMLQTCASLDDAIAFYETHEEPGFGYAKVLVAERSGASAVIGARDGRLHVERLERSRAFGYGGGIAAPMLEGARPTLEAAARILLAARQEGQYPTQYSNVFDLRRGEIVLYRFQDSGDPVRLSLAQELAHPAHAFDLASLWHPPAARR
jgi:hypothetical protein